MAASTLSTGTRTKRIVPTSRPSRVPSTLAQPESSTVSHRPCSRNGGFLRMTSGIGETSCRRLVARTWNEQDELARGRHQHEIDERDGDVDLERAEGLPVDRAGLVGEFADGDDRGERGILDELREQARERRRVDAL